jgi:[ribosomal protein S5]-alanine N-acetyltransferase
MPQAPTLSGTALMLRPPVPSDIDERLALGRSPEILHGFGVESKDLPALTRVEVVAWLDDIAASSTAWVVAREGRFLGEIRLRDVDLNDRRARLGIAFYDPTLLGQGLGRAAIRILFTYAFQELQLHRLSLRVLADNLRAVACYRACGFVEEGCERESALVGNLWVDDLIMGCLAHEASY